VSPASISALPSACGIKSGVIFTGRNWSAVRPSTRKNNSPFRVPQWVPQKFVAPSVTTTPPTVNILENRFAPKAFENIYGPEQSPLEINK
jgi:hypothetical protein